MLGRDCRRGISNFATSLYYVDTLYSQETGNREALERKFSDLKIWVETVYDEEHGDLPKRSLHRLSEATKDLLATLESGSYWGVEPKAALGIVAGRVVPLKEEAVPKIVSFRPRLWDSDALLKYEDILIEEMLKFAERECRLDGPR